ncbi:helicase-associated domain-containing protein [Actinomadura macra]|uniref:helicase-associated domain-containing protein n=1 Tax=Actinomadura macra TaxID=46164 RepID=UPI00082DE232|nr:helicase-associated domain-containing protein [Actinomadura macra]
MEGSERGSVESFGRWLGRLGQEDLAGLLGKRPEAMAEPEPLTIGEVAERLYWPHGVFTALAACELRSVQVAEVLAALGEGTPRADAQALLGATLEDFDGAVAGLVLRGLAWPDGDLLHLVEPLRDWPLGNGPLGLGPPAAVLLPHLRADVLRRVTRELGVEPVGRRKAELLDAAIQGLRDAERVRHVAAAAPQRVRRLLERAARDGFVDDFRNVYMGGADGPQEWALARGLLVQADWLAPVMPAEVALALRGPSYRPPFTPAAPVAATVAAPEDVTAAEFAAASARALEETASVVRLCASEPPTRLKSGGVGVRELRRTAKRTGCAEDAARLWLEVAVADGLLGWCDGALVPTGERDEQRTPGMRLASMLRSWKQMTRLPLLDDPEATRGAPLDPRADDPAAPVLRVAVLESLAGLPESRGVTGPEELVAMVTWRRPLLFEDAELAPPYVTAVWREAERLGVIANGVLTSTGRALLDADGALSLDEVAADVLDSACAKPLLQGDLTAVVPGPPAPWLAELLDLVAARESRGTASVWRFGPGSVRRAFDAGLTAERLKTDLRAAAGTDLPQPLAYLIDDVARRHGEVAVTPLACAISCSRPALLTEILAHRGLRRLGLRELAPTVLASAEPVNETLEALRQAGYFPIGPDGGGSLVIERAPARQRRRKRPDADVPRSSVPSRRTTPLELAARLHETPVVPRTETDGVEARVADLAPQLSASELRVLAHAVETGTAVCIDYVNGEGNPSTRVIEKICLDAPFLTAWCRLRDDERVFLGSRVQAVTPAFLAE